ncbi:ornithine cyclodeaminase family protein [Paenibacillus eucommiae]|uniref:Ornithine cyclodeaminase/alanine dehydrogenase n=1 Tax=Paenibacillus eucommiae TaxID=1355755 RepID=A0ABS4IY15_9BACL|nr:ornithine cyclodeaminase family protein [Paenibacillus eucommiae]MBP1992463.1 ornithine cyclodeaminase/alanine dehydrogenase [Paenibacillus eucommiae]
MKHTDGTLLIDQASIEKCLTMKDVVEICDRTFQGFGEGTTINPTKVTLDLGEESAYPPYEGFMNAMPAYVGHLDTAGMKFVGGFLGERRKQGLPYLTGLIVLVNPHTGNFTAILEGAHITNMRTGAQTAIALKYIKKASSIRLGLYGAGMQGHTQTMAISEIFDIEELRVFDSSKESAQRFKENMKPYVKGEIIIADTPEQAADADAVVAVTPSKDKFIRDSWIKPGTVVFPMGSYQECEDALILNADKIIVDHVSQALHRGALKKLHAEGLIEEKHLYATIGELAVGTKTVEDENGRILCIPIGTGALDVAIGQVVLDRIKAQGGGFSFSFV